MKFHLLALSSSLLLGAGLSAIQPGKFLLGWLLFSFLFLLSFYAIRSTQEDTYTSTQVHTPSPTSYPLTPNSYLLSPIQRIILLAFLLRLALGAALYLALPVAGYDNPQSRAGYIFSDSFRRDEQAWELAHSDAPILSAFNKNFYSDQYGGLLAFDALAYRYLSPDAHRPLLPVFFGALTAALGLAFLWKAAARQWDEKVAFAAAWIYALYPDSILFGSAQMREPFLMAFVAMTLWGFVAWQTAGRGGSSSEAYRDPCRDQRIAWLWLALGFAGMLLVSPAIALLMLIILAGWWWIQREHGRVSWIALAAAGLVFLAGLYLLAWGLERQQSFGSSPLGIIMDWSRAAIKWDTYQLQLGSGVVQKRFDELPEALHPLFVIVYGITQPVLPAALTEPTVPLFRFLMTFRALGWYALVPLLFYAPFASFRTSRGSARRLWFWLTAITWLWIIVAALRGGADQWDNPRYRAILIALQALVAGFAWLNRDRWLVRWLAVEAVFLAVFSQWYVSRYYDIMGRISFGSMVTVILILSTLIFAGGWWWDRRHKGR